jgi:hypothetical protein
MAVGARVRFTTPEQFIQVRTRGALRLFAAKQSPCSSTPFHSIYQVISLKGGLNKL